MDSLITFEDIAGATAPFTKEETIQLRSQFIPKACKLQFEKSPIKVVRASAQYLYDDGGNEFLDCINCVAHVGHCNPMVVEAAKKAMLQMGNLSVERSDVVSEYISQLRTTLPTEIDTFLFVSSASEANDLAIQMSRLHTGGYDVVSVEGNFHGGVTLPNSVSPRQFCYERGIAGNENYSYFVEKRPDWVHVVQCPDLYRGKYRDTDYGSDPVEKYCKDGEKVFKAAVQDNRKLACFISESLMTTAGIILPPSKWMHSMYNEIRSHGGLAIADEAQSGLGRSGTSMWCFQLFDDNLVPDIITIGKPLGNGHPMACIATKSTIAASFLKNTTSNEVNYTCDSVSAAVGLAVINTIRSQSLQMNARTVGDFLREGIRSLGVSHQNIGQVRGTGLMVGVEIVNNQLSRKPARDIAERICYKLLEHFVIVENEGPLKNVLTFTPPMCFTCQNAHHVLLALEIVLKEIEKTPVIEFLEPLPPPPVPSFPKEIASISGHRLLSFNEFVSPMGRVETSTTEGLTPLPFRCCTGTVARRAPPSSTVTSSEMEIHPLDLLYSDHSFSAMD